MWLVKNRSTLSPHYYNDEVTSLTTEASTYSGSSDYQVIDEMIKPPTQCELVSRGIQTIDKRGANYENKIKTKSSTTKNYETLFGAEIGPNAGLIADFSGAILRDMIISGRLYISSSHLCFYGSLLKWETKIVIPLKEISSIVKAKTIKVIPNAIQVVTRTGDKYLFTSLVSRQKVYSTLVSAWTANLSRRLTNCDTNNNKTSVDPSIRKCYSNLESGSKRINDNSKEMKCSTKSNRKYFSTGDLADINDTRKPCSKVEEIIADESPKFCKPLRDPSSCPYQESKCLADVVLPINLDRLFDMLFTNSHFASTFAESLKHEINITREWCTPSESDLKESDKPIIGVRQFSRQMVLDYTFAKNMSSEETMYLEHLDSSNYYGIRLVSESAGVPLCSLFYVVNYFCLHRTANPAETHFHFHYKLVFKSRAWGFKSLIEDGSRKGCQDYCDAWIKMMKKWSTDYPESVSKIGLSSQLKMFCQDDSFIDSNQNLNSQPLIHATQPVAQLSLQTNAAQQSNVSSTASNQCDSNSLSSLSSAMPEKSTYKASSSVSCSNCKSCDDSHVNDVMKNLKPFIVFLLLLTIINLSLLLVLINNRAISSCPSNQVSSPALIGLSTADETFESLSNYAYPSLGCHG
ncbi:GRAM domain-containing protein 1C-like [Tetranychus urticae]|uniref:GRAM domain-containing protein 1C-like n=1 Tax=Tetranychus urticae TaxID=32264 RepID=UPI00077BBC28|nr:GRAM domain-containing protein 1C-like [Tetranychus urticae]XP_025018541.1 GRAM domain-containing protein 1C-like [Tetranychus urticae]